MSPFSVDKYVACRQKVFEQLGRHDRFLNVVQAIELVAKNENMTIPEYNVLYDMVYSQIYKQTVNTNEA